jgi:hypothetical protein
VPPGRGGSDATFLRLLGLALAERRAGSFDPAGVAAEFGAAALADDRPAARRACRFPRPGRPYSGRCVRPQQTARAEVGVATSTRTPARRCQCLPPAPARRMDHRVGSAPRSGAGQGGRFIHHSSGPSVLVFETNKAYPALPADGCLWHAARHRKGRAFVARPAQGGFLQYVDAPGGPHTACANRPQGRALDATSARTVGFGMLRQWLCCCAALDAAHTQVLSDTLSPLAAVSIRSFSARGEVRSTAQLRSCRGQDPKGRA